MEEKVYPKIIYGTRAITESEAMTSKGDHILLGLMSDKQRALFLNLLNSCKSCTHEKLTGENCLNRIIDTSASYHMTRNLKCSPNLREVTGCAVRLLDDNQAMVLKEGSVRLRE